MNGYVSGYVGVLVVGAILLLGLPASAAPQSLEPVPATASATGSDTPHANFQESGCFTDRTGDVTNGLDGPSAAVPQADIVRWCANYSSTSLRVSVQVAQPADPVSDSAWNGYGAAVVVFYSDAEGDPRTLQMAKGERDDRFDYYVFEGSATDPICQGNATFIDNTYAATAPQTCLNSPQEVDVQIAMFYGRDANGTFDTSPRDYAPDRGFVTVPQGDLSGGERIPRFAGPERITTAIEVSRGSFPDGTAGAVVLASSEAFPDALVAAPLSVTVNGPVLLTPKSTLTQSVSEEIIRVAGGPTTVYVMGGTAALDMTVESALTDAGHTVRRVAGNNRFETSIAAAEAANAEPSTILLAFGGAFGDALVSGAAAPLFNGTVVLIDRGGIPAAVQTYLDAHPQADKFPVGDTAIAASPELDGAVPGATPATVSVNMAAIYPEPTEVTVASGESFPDGLSGGAYAARRLIPLLLSSKDSMDTATLDFLRDSGPWDSITFFGGVAALSDTVAAQAASTLSQ